MRCLAIFIIYLLALSQLGCTGVFYQPDQIVYLDPSQSDLEMNEGWVHTKDSQRLHYWRFPSRQKKPKGSILHFHGNAQNMSSHFMFVLWLIEAGYDVISFDYRGYGQSTGHPSPEGMQLDAEAMLSYSCANFKKPLFIIAQSLGGAIATTALANGNGTCGCGLILDSTFDSYRDIARDKLSDFFLTWPFQYPLSYLIDDSTSPSHVLDKIELPTLVIHAKNDPVVPHFFGDRIFQNISSKNKTFWSLDTGGHTAAFVPKSPYKKRLVSYLDKLGPECSQHRL